MKTIYEVIITGDKVTWIGDRPDAQAEPIRGRLQIGEGNSTGKSAPSQLPPPTDGRLLAALMRDIAEKTGGIESIPDPVAWQSEQREDRPLPGREP